MELIFFAAIILSIILGILGSIALWKKYTYFADGFAHSAIFAAITASILNIPVNYSGILFSIVFVSTIFKYKKSFDGNIAINLVSNLFLSIAIILGCVFQKQVNINRLLFGDIISINLQDIYILLIIMFFTICFFYFYYRKIILLSINDEIAKTQGIDIEKLEIFFLILFSISIFIIMKIFGMLLVSGMLIAPTMTARICAKTPVNMVIFSIIFGAFFSLIGIIMSYYIDYMPIAPLIILIGSISYLLIYSIKALRKYNK